MDPNWEVCPYCETGRIRQPSEEVVKPSRSRELKPEALDQAKPPSRMHQGSSQSRAKGESKLGLIQVIDSLREGIESMTSEVEQGKRVAMFKVDQCKIRLTVAVEKKATAGINVWVIDAETDVSHLTTHEVEITITPLRPQTPCDRVESLTVVG